MKQLKLFDIPEQEKIKPLYTCRKCKHKYKHQYGKMLYCRKQINKRTSYGNKKIKSGDTACHMYEPII